MSHRAASRVAGALLAAAALGATGVPALAPAFAQSAPALEPRALFDAEICQVDGLSPAQCNCAWQFVQAKLAASELRIAMLLTAANSENDALASQASKALAGLAVPARRQDELQSAVSALTVEAEDRCTG
jgi:hypothetical protein